MATANAQAVGGALSGAAFPGARPVTGQPYSAQQETQTIRTLADGTHITSKPQTTTLYRDSQGRTRTEHTFGGDGGINPMPQVMIEIEDPVAGYHYQLNSYNRLAFRRQFAPRGVTAQGSAVSGQAPALGPSAPATGSTPPGLLPGQSRPGAARPEVQQRMPQASRESLGTRDFSGVSAEGTRTTTVWPVGSIGNDQPITAVTEVWMSRELGIELSRTASDPRNGDTTLRLLNISRAEPDPSLFQPSADYRIEDVKPNQ